MASSFVNAQSKNSWAASAFVESAQMAAGYTMFLCVSAGTVLTIFTPPKRYTSELYTIATSTSPELA